ncbi:MAG: hypothetical protein ACKPKO_62945 [Candidatus Fonsibacter sp.]
MKKRLLNRPYVYNMRLFAFFFNSLNYEATMSRTHYSSFKSIC